MAEEENKPKRYRRTNVDIQADIIKAAESLIKKKGFASMLVTELIKKARIEPLVFYNRYDNLSEFYDEFVKRYDYWFKDVLTGIQFPADSELGYISIFKDVHKALQDKSVMLELLRWGNSRRKMKPRFVQLCSGKCTHYLLPIPMKRNLKILTYQPYRH